MDDRDEGPSSIWSIAIIVAGGLIFVLVLVFVFFRLRPI